MIRSFLVTLFQLSAVLMGYSQDLRLFGIVRDAESNSPIPFASISITKTTRGTAADENGKFTLIIKPEEKNQELKISSIGHLTRFFKINSLDTGYLRLELESDVRLLSEITINENVINPIDIVKSAIDSLAANYRIEPFNMEYYSAMNASNGLTSEEFKIETMVLGYCKGYEKNSEKKFEILSKRTEGNNFLKAVAYPFWPTLELHRADVISDPFKTGILNLDNIDKFEFVYAGVSVYESDTVYQIDYHAPKPSKKITGYGIVPSVYKGSIYITTESSAIVRHDIETDQFQHSIIYKKVGEKYFPYLVTGKRSLKSANAFIKIQNSITLTSVKFDDIKVIDYPTNEFRDIAEIPEDAAYWETNFPKVRE